MEPTAFVVIAVLAAFALILAIVTWLLASWVARLRRRVRELDSGKRSQSTRYGQITEQFAPFLAAWPWDPKAFRFIGTPVDGVQFNDDGIVFVEVKAADSRLSPLQRQIRDHVEAGRVSWREVRIG